MTGDEILQVRKALGLSQQHFGQLLGAHQMTVSKWERGVLEPSAYQTALVDAFQVAAKKQQVRGQIEGVLIGFGLAAALLLLLQAAKR